MSLERPDRVEVLPYRFTVVTALPLRGPARERLAQLLDARVVDVRDPVDRADLVLTPSSSPQLIGALQRKYEGAKVVVVELDDWEFDISLPGPVKRLVRGGADGYVVADSLDELAGKLAPRRHQRSPDDTSTADAAELLAPAAVDDLVAPFLRASAERPEPARIDDETGPVNPRR